jgi:hypothetical protein
MNDTQALRARPGVEVAIADRRASERIAKPFDAWRVGNLDTPVRIYDISMGGCFVNAMHEQDAGVVVVLRIQLPGEQWLEVKAETLYRRPGFGFAVKFVELTDASRAQLERALELLAR